MVSAEEDIQYLILIVRKDEEIQNKKKFLKNAPARIGRVDSDISRMDSQFAENSAAVAALEAENRKLLGKVKDQNENIAKKKALLAQIRENKEYKAMKHEIEFLENQVNEEEERILVIMDQMVVRVKDLEEIKKKIANEKGALLEEKRKLEEETARDMEALRKLEEDKSKILPNLSGRVQRLYERIKEAKGDSGVANLVGDVCQGCHSRVPPQKAHEIRRNDSIIMCEVCGRILVFYDDTPSS